MISIRPLSRRRSDPDREPRGARPPSATARGPVLLLVLTLAVPFHSNAQVVTGDLSGRVVSTDGRPVDGLDVRVTGPDLQGTRLATTDEDGSFRVLQLPVGTYALRLSRLGYRETVVEEVRVRLGRTTALPDLVVETAALELEPLRVVASQPVIDPRSTEVGAVLESAEFEMLPLERDHRFLAVLVPGAEQSFYGDDLNVGGATGMENRYFVDGIDVSDPFRGASGLRLPYNFVEALQVRTGGYQAEYQGALGGALDVLTRSGGDRWSGSVFGFFSNSRFAAEPRRGVTEPGLGDFAQYDVGISLGGPVVGDRLRFFGAYNPVVEREEVQVTGHGLFEDRTVRHIFAAKLDWKPAPEHQVAINVVGDPVERDAVGVSFYGAGGIPRALESPDPLLGVQEVGGVAVSASGTHLLGPSLLLETSLSRFTHATLSRPAGRGSPDEPLVVERATGVWSGGFLERLDERSTLWSAGAKLTWTPSEHTLKVGAGFRENRLDSDTYGDLLLVFPSRAFQWHLERPGTVRHRIPSAFVQDSWRVHDRLVLNAGLRWEGEWLLGGDGEVAQAIPDELQPRVGFVLTPGDGAPQRIAGSWGRYYQEISTFVSQRHFSGAGQELFILHDGDPTAGPTNADTVPIPSTQPEADLRGQHEDAFSLEYERQVGEHAVLGVQGVYRSLGDVLENGRVSELGDEFRLGNPGRGVLHEYPRPWRRYRALVLSAARRGAERLSFRASYALSRNEGNHAGLYHAVGKWAWPLNGHFDSPHLLENAEGLLPNDRTHVLKLSGSYRTAFGLDVGTFFTWQSGTPLSELCCSAFAFYRPRGTAGRTPALADLDLRLAYDLDALGDVPGRPRLLLDLFNIGSGGTVVDMDQMRYFGPHPDGNLTPNPFWGSPIRHHPPFAVRLGLEATF